MNDQGMALTASYERYLPPAVLAEPLTPREREVMDCLSRRMMDREIADALQVSINTVKHHLRNIYSKFGVGSRRRAVEHYRAIAA